MGKRYLILGASSDLCCEFLRQHEWQQDDVIVAHYCRNRGTLEEISQRISAKMELWQADFSNEESTLSFANRLKEDRYVPTHILHVPAVPINNLRFTEISWADAQRQLNVQCRSLWIILQAVIKSMAKEKTGKIIIILSSYSLNVPPKFLSDYVMTKYSLMGLGKSLAVEYAAKGIQVNMISPSMMDTKFLVNIYDGIVENSEKNNPSKRNARPEDVVGLIEYLFSDRNTFITGVNFPVTGGEVF